MPIVQTAKGLARVMWHKDPLLGIFYFEGPARGCHAVLNRHIDQFSLCRGDLQNFMYFHDLPQEEALEYIESMRSEIKEGLEKRKSQTQTKVQSNGKKQSVEDLPPETLLKKEFINAKKKLSLEEKLLVDSLLRKEVSNGE